MHSVSGEDISVCVCLAILTSLFDDEGSYPYGTRYLHLLPVLSLRLLLCVKLCLNLKAIFLSGIFDDGKSFNQTRITKLEMRRRLVFICKFASNARPSRGNLKQVFSFLGGGSVDPV